MEIEWKSVTTPPEHGRNVAVTDGWSVATGCLRSKVWWCFGPFITPTHWCELADLNLPSEVQDE